MIATPQRNGIKLDPALLGKIAGAGAPLHERIAHPEWFCFDDLTGSAQKRLEKWIQTSAHGDEAAFDRILLLRQLNRASVSKFLGDAVWNADFPLPSWTKLLSEAIELTAECNDLLDPAQPWPFEELVAPFVLAARERLQARAGKACLTARRDVHRTGERTLLYWLCNICAPAFGLELSIFRLKHRRADAGVVYREFVEQMSRETYPAFLTEYCVLARVISQVLEQWIASYSDLLIRFSGDREELEQRLGGSSDLGELIEIQTGMSDPHNGGRTVAALVFSSGLRLVYKPKPLGLDEDYSNLLNWIASREPAFDLRPAETVNCNDYGWNEFIEHVPATNDAERRLFYHRSGLLLALLYVLESTDAHNENVIARRDQPILVDLETLLNPRVGEFEPGKVDEFAELAAQQRVNQSVLRTRMLPFWRNVEAGKPYDASALGGLGGEETIAAVWRDVKSADYRLESVVAHIEGGRSAPVLRDGSSGLLTAVEEVTGGFRDMYRWLMTNRQELMSVGSPLDQLTRHEVRYVFRDTETYFKLLKGSFEPRLLRNGADRSIHLEALNWLLAAGDGRDRYAGVVCAEVRALERGDIPYFSAPPGERSLYAEGASVAENFFSHSSRERLMANLTELSDVDLENQCEVIRGSFYSRCALPPSPHSCKRTSAELTEACMEVDFLPAAIEIGRTLQKQAIRGTDGSVSWLSLCWAPSGRVYQYQPVGISLYDGGPGIAFFLAALESVTKSGEFRSLALGAVTRVHRVFKCYGENSALMRNSNLCAGALEGAGGAIWACAKVGGLLNEQRPLEIAQTVARLYGRSETIGNQRADLAGGIAGFVLGLNELHRVTGENEWRQMASDLGQKLELQLQNGKQVLNETGLAKGQAGIDFVRHRVFGANVRDFTQNVPAEVGSDPTWYSGTAGFGLVTLAKNGAAIYSAPMLSTLPLNPDTYAYGSAGVLDMLTTLSHRNGDSALLRTVRRHAANIIARSKAEGGYSVIERLPRDAKSLGLFEGIAGIGYTWLRLAEPGSLPPILIEA